MSVTLLTHKYNKRVILTVLYLYMMLLLLTMIGRQDLDVRGHCNIIPSTNSCSHHSYIAICEKGNTAPL